jgi:hypothetical protein
MRYVTPAFGRWTQQDPKERPLDPAQADRYAYAGDDPVNRVDPSGTCFIVSCDVYHHVSTGFQDALAFGYEGAKAGFVGGFELGFTSASELGAVPAAFIGGVSGSAGAVIVGVPAAAVGGVYGVVSGKTVDTGAP